MIVTVVLCNLHHPSKPLYAGHSPAQLVEITGYDPSARPRVFSRELEETLADVSFHRSVVIVRITVAPPSVMPDPHCASLVRAIRKRSTYGKSQRILVQRVTPRRRQPFSVLCGQGGSYPWDSCWQTTVPAGALKLEKARKPKRPPQ